jgi:hypothetical protein
MSAAITWVRSAIAFAKTRLTSAASAAPWLTAFLSCASGGLTGTTRRFRPNTAKRSGNGARATIAQNNVDSVIGAGTCPW